MPGRVNGKVAFITGAARGQGRSHALLLADEGADIIAIDALADYKTVTYPMATQADMDETVTQVQQRGRKIVALQADVRDAAAVKSAVETGVKELGRLDIVCANAGIAVSTPWDQATLEAWQDVIDTNLTGVWNSVLPTVPHLIAAGGGSIICTSSSAGIKGLPFLSAYAASKHGVVGLVKTLANELATHSIRVNSIHPAGVVTPMAADGAIGGKGQLSSLIANRPDLGPIFMNALPVERVQPIDISNAVLFLASDESRYVTGLQLKVDAGNTNR